jgi:hypothetical protein
MFKKIKKLVKKDLVNKHKRVIIEALEAAIKTNVYLKEELLSSQVTKRGEFLDFNFLGVKKLSLLKLKDVDIKDLNVLDAFNKGHSAAITHISNSTISNKVDLQLTLDVATDVAHKESLRILKEKERAINRIRSIFFGLVAAGGVIFMSL